MKNKGKPKREDRNEEDEVSRLEEMAQALSSIAAGDFSVSLETSPRQDELDAVALGISMLAEELGSLEIERRQADEELKRANDELEDYAKLVAHEIRTPLSGVFLVLEYLERLAGTMSPGGLDSEAAAIIEQAKKTVSKTEYSVDQLLKLAKAGQVPEDIEDVNVRSVVGGLLPGLKDEIDRKSAVMQSDNDLGVVRADPLHIQLIFSNLISNALEHCDSREPLIEIRMLDSTKAGGNRYLVKDNGSGMPVEYLGELTAASLPPKSGLGIVTVVKIVKVYGGSMTAYNDAGACIEFTLKDYDEAGS